MDKKLPKLKTYVLMVSRVFPGYHPKKGQHTFFREKINEALVQVTDTPIFTPKLHTLRKNYSYWAKRIEAVQQGKAVLSVRQWKGRPYHSDPVEFIVLDSTTGLGIQKLERPDNFIHATVDGKVIDWGLIADNDGLDFTDFCHWFNVRSPEPMAVIHFTGFRY